MKVLHLVGGSIDSGAGKGALWLHLSQLEAGIDSKLLTNSLKSNVNYPFVEFAINNFFSLYYELLKTKLFSYFPLKFYRKREKYIFSLGVNGFNFFNLDCYKEADIIHLHWINGLVSIDQINKIDKPIVWTLRDMWPFTGGCHISLGCDRYKKYCGKCPQLGSNHSFDLSSLVLNMKKKYFNKRIIIVGISDWISECARNSSVFREYEIKTISNNVNTSLFKPIEKYKARSILKISDNKKIVLLGAEVIDEPWKGFHKFIESIKYLDLSKLHFLFFGTINRELIINLGIDFTLLGRINSIEELSIIYSSADVFVAPSIFDSFGKTLVESISCGTLVVCFDATGPKDIVEHKLSGYKAKPYDSLDLANGINWVLNLDNSEYFKLAQRGRTRIVNLFDSKEIAYKYKLLYKEILTYNKFIYE